jgi:ubiquinone/menaquinone biosynthesis C-methylase UbiE
MPGPESDATLRVIREEFAQQADAMSRAPAFTDDRAVEPFVRLLGAPLPSPILDLACGPGIVSAALARAGAEVTGLDATPAMLDAARTRCAAQSVTVTFHEGNAEALPFADATFSAAVTRLSIHHFAEPSAVLAELRRVLASGAALVVGDIVSSSLPQEAALHNALEHLRDPSHQRCLTEHELVAAIEAAGFAIEAIESFENPKDFEDWAAIVADARSIEPVRVVMGALADAGEQAGIALRRDGETIRFVHHWRFVRATAN